MYLVCTMFSGWLMKRPLSQAGIIYDTFELAWVEAYKFVMQNLEPKMSVSMRVLCCLTLSVQLNGIDKHAFSYCFCISFSNFLYLHIC